MPLKVSPEEVRCLEVVAEAERWLSRTKKLQQVIMMLLVVVMMIVVVIVVIMFIVAMVPVLIAMIVNCLQ